MGFIKNNKRFFILFIVCLVAIILFTLQGTHFYTMVGDYYSGNKYQRFIGWEVSSPIQLYLEVLDRTYYFDSLLTIGTNPLQTLIPIFSIVGCISFYKRYHRILKFSFVKIVHFKRELYRIIIIDSLKLALALFFAYLCFYMICDHLMFFNTNPVHSVLGEGRSFLADLLPQDFYFRHTYLYFLFDELVWFFYIPFIYAMLVQASALIIPKPRYFLAIVILCCYVLFIISNLIIVFAPRYIIYINPLLRSIKNVHMNSKVLLLINSIPLFLSIAIIEWRGRHVEI